jgi:hypothetical protein
LSGLDSNLFETHPKQNGTGNVIADNSSLAALATFQAGQLPGFAVKLPDIPTKAARLLCGLRVVLRHVSSSATSLARDRIYYVKILHLFLCQQFRNISCT